MFAIFHFRALKSKIKGYKTVIFSDFLLYNGIKRYMKTPPIIVAMLL